jgi:hypothetical protein
MEKNNMSLIDDVKKSIQDDLGEIKETANGIKTAGEMIEDQTGQIDIEDILANAPTDEKGNKIIDDSIFDQYYKQLPEKCINKSGTWRTTSTGGKLKIFGTDIEEDRQIQKAGGEALQAALKHRRSMSEDIQIALLKKANPETIATLGLDPGANNQQAVIAAAILQAIEGNVKAQQFIRDTIGEQPTAKQDISLQMTDDDRSLLEKVENRLNG